MNGSWVPAVFEWYGWENRNESRFLKLIYVPMNLVIYLYSLKKKMAESLNTVKKCHILYQDLNINLGSFLKRAEPDMHER